MTTTSKKQTTWRGDFDFYRYSLPLRGRQQREGILVKIKDSNLQVGWGDAAPLPGWSVESLDDVRRYIEDPHCSSPMPSSLACALQSARASIAHIQNETEEVLALNSLLDGSPRDILAQAGDAIGRGCECLKIKAAGLSSDELVDTVSSISQLAPAKCRFRIDSNRSWEFEDALRVAEALKEFRVEYFEEPLRNAGRLPDFIRVSPVGIALDETLRELRPSELPHYKGAVAMVLKPTLMGGFEACTEFAEAGAALGMASVVSACYESGVGIYALGRFALSLSRVSAAGLDTYSRLEADLLCERLDLRNFGFHGNKPMPDVDISKLHPL